MSKSNGFDTNSIHAGEPKPRIKGAITLPIFQSATYDHDEDLKYDDIKYMRLSNTPNHEALNKKLAILENGEEGFVGASGMASISATLISCLEKGDHVLLQNGIYGGTYGLVTQHFPAMGIDFDFIDATNKNQWSSKLKPKTKAIYVETISNPLLEIPDLRAVVEFAKANRLMSIIDNTFASPVNFRPIEVGFDLVVHSATKYLNGHSDIVAGVVVGRKSQIQKIAKKQKYFGGSLDAHACFLLQRGLKTLGVRMRYQNESALKIAQHLEKHSEISKVHYPGLKSHAQHSRAQELFSGFGGMISFRVKDPSQKAQSLLKKLELIAHAPSLGGVESLITRPAHSSHGNLSKEDKEKTGITDDLFRLSVGLETTSDLVAELDSALS